MIYDLKKKKYMGVPPVLIHVIFGFSMKTIQPSWAFLVHQAQRVQLKNGGGGIMVSLE